MDPSPLEMVFRSPLSLSFRGPGGLRSRGTTVLFSRWKYPRTIPNGEDVIAEPRFCQRRFR